MITFRWKQCSLQNVTAPQPFSFVIIFSRVIDVFFFVFASPQLYHCEPKPPVCGSSSQMAQTTIPKVTKSKFGILSGTFHSKKGMGKLFYAHIFILVQYSIILWHSTVSDVVPLPQIKCSMNEFGIFHRRTYSNLFLSTERDMLPQPLKFLEQPWRWCIRTFFKQKSPHLHNFIFNIPNLRLWLYVAFTACEDINYVFVGLLRLK